MSEEYGYYDLGDGLVVDSHGEIISADVGDEGRAAVLAHKLYYATEERTSWGEVEGACKAALRRLQPRGVTTYGEVAVEVTANTRRSVDSVTLRQLLDAVEAPREVLLSVIEQGSFTLDIAATVQPLMEGATLPSFIGELTKTNYYTDKVRARPVRRPAPKLRRIDGPVEGLEESLAALGARE